MFEKSTLLEKQEKTFVLWSNEVIVSLSLSMGVFTLVPIATSLWDRSEGGNRDDLRSTALLLSILSLLLYLMQLFHSFLWSCTWNCLRNSFSMIQIEETIRKVEEDRPKVYLWCRSSTSLQKWSPIIKRPMEISISQWETDTDDLSITEGGLLHLDVIVAPHASSERRFKTVKAQYDRDNRQPHTFYESRMSFHSQTEGSNKFYCGPLPMGLLLLYILSSLLCLRFVFQVYLNRNIPVHSLKVHKYFILPDE